MNEVVVHLLPVVAGFLLDLILGDPQGWPHPVRWIGGAISFGEKKLRPAAEDDGKKLFILGAALSAVVMSAAFAVPFVILLLAGRVSIWLRVVVESVFCYQILAVKSLRTESMKIYENLSAKDIVLARKSLSWIVGRDTEGLNEAQIAKAAVETVAENCSDGVIAPLFYLCMGGAPLGFLYKAINTLDSMIGYKNERYACFGKFAAKIDDIANFIPSRICAVLMLAAGALPVLRCSFPNGAKTFIRDRFNHSSPNSAQTESVCAGLLGVQLAGDAYYGGVLVSKPTIGDPVREIEVGDIVLVNRLMYATAFLGLVIFSMASAILMIWM